MTWLGLNFHQQLTFMLGLASHCFNYLMSQVLPSFTARLYLPPNFGPARQEEIQSHLLWQWMIQDIRNSIHRNVLSQAVYRTTEQLRHSVLATAAHPPTSTVIISSLSALHTFRSTCFIPSGRNILPGKYRSAGGPHEHNASAYLTFITERKRWTCCTWKKKTYNFMECHSLEMLGHIWFFSLFWVSPRWECGF